MPKVVFDTVVFVRSLINPHGIWGELVSLSDSYELFLSQPVLTEILKVLNRPEITSKFRALNSLNKDTVMDILGQAGIVDVSDIQPISRDPKDDKFLATALACDADYLVTEDNDLLVLKKYERTKIIRAKTFLEILHEKNS